MSDFATGMVVGNAMSMGMSHCEEDLSRNDLIQFEVCKAQKTSEMQLQCFSALQNKFKLEDEHIGGEILIILTVFFTFVGLYFLSKKIIK